MILFSIPIKTYFDNLKADKAPPVIFGDPKRMAQTPGWNPLDYHSIASGGAEIVLLHETGRAWAMKLAFGPYLTNSPFNRQCFASMLAILT